jgi:U2-associated protein SR140
MLHLSPKKSQDYISSVIFCITPPVVVVTSGNIDNCISSCNGINFRFEARMGSVFSHLHDIYASFDGRIKADNFRRQIMAVTSVWETWMVFNNSNVEAWIKTFLGRVDEEERTSEEPVEQVVEKPVEKKGRWKSVAETSGKEITAVPLISTDDAEEDVDGDEMGEEVDGMPMEEDVDGMPLEEEDVDGEPMDDDIDGQPMEEEDVDGTPMEEPQLSPPAPLPAPAPSSPETQEPKPATELPRPQKRQRMRAVDMFTD